MATPPDTEDGDRPHTQPAGRVRRLFADGTIWHVHEIAAPPFDRRAGTHLIFESQEIVRRVRVFPANWDALSDADLYALCSR